MSRPGTARTAQAGRSSLKVPSTRASVLGRYAGPHLPSRSENSSPDRPAAAAAASSSASSPSPSSSNPYGVLTVDPPGPTEAVLTITGGTAGPVALTPAQLEALGTETVTLDEPFVKQRLTFSGVAMDKVLAKAGIPAGANITTKALND